MSDQNVSHVIFDMDGLLLDTESLYTEGTQNVVSEFNKTYTWELKVKVMGKHILESSQLIVDELNLPITAEKFVELTKMQYRKLFPNAKLMPGAEKLVRHLHDKKIPIAIATGSDMENYELKTENHKELFKLFHHILVISSDPEVKRGKPAPDPFLICASRFPDKPSNDKVLVFEDAPNGVQSALAAGMKVVMVPDARLDKSTVPKGVTILSSLEDFKPETFGLPPYNV